jgi:hypothetical protein
MKITGKKDWLEKNKIKIDKTKDIRFYPNKEARDNEWGEHGTLVKKSKNWLGHTVYHIKCGNKIYKVLGKDITDIITKGD